MKWLARHGILASLVLAGIVGSILGARGLKQAIAKSQNLYRVDTAGSQIESDLEYETQESRRAFLYALTSQDPNEQLPYIDQARAAGNRVLAGVERLRSLRAPEIDQCINRFARAWDEYRGARDQIIALVLEGELKSAMSVEKLLGQPAFNAALANLHELKATLEEHARIGSAEVNRTLQHSAAGLAGFAVSTLLIVVWLGKANRDRRVALGSLGASNAALASEREMEEQRASVLELVSSHAPLVRSLDQIVKLAPRCSRGAGAAVWAVAGTHLHFQVAANLPVKLAEILGQLLLETPDAMSRPPEEFVPHRAAWSTQFGMLATESRVLRDAGGRLIGLLQMFAPDDGASLRTAVVDQMAQLAAVAIDNTLLYERLAFQVQHDTLTELPNRMLFQDRVQHALQFARRRKKRLALLWIDLDRFTQINDTLGHRVGDEMLCEAARRLKGCLRESDTVARVGGDEFTVLAHDISSPSGHDLVCRTIIAALSRPMRLGEHEIAITASVGVSIFPDHGADPMTLMRHADLAMYSAKHDGGNCFRLFRPALRDTLVRRLQVEKELRTALERNEFSLDYQPLMDCEGRLDCLEALIRWTNPALGPVSPADFIPIAEEIGSILTIGEWVARTACDVGANWIRAGLQVPPIAVNISSVQFAGIDFGRVVERVLQETGFPAAKLILEITETVLMNNLEQALRQISHLRLLGVRFAIDDFGTGYSSLSQLRTLPVDFVKIDRSFVKDLDIKGSGSSTLVRGIIALAHSLALEVVAEGVETKEQLALLRAMGCDIIQGFYLYKPMPRAQVEKLLVPSLSPDPQPELAELQSA